MRFLGMVEAIEWGDGIEEKWKSGSYFQKGEGMGKKGLGERWEV